jgi:hypothetical protein
MRIPEEEEEEEEENDDDDSYVCHMLSLLRQFLTSLNKC